MTAWIPLSQKWRLMGQQADKNSVVFVMKAADDYSGQGRLAESYKTLRHAAYDWFQTDKGHFYHILTGKMILYSHGMKGPLYRTRSALAKATLTIHARRLPLSSLRKGVDNWFLSTIRTPRIHYRQGKGWEQDLYTQGMNVISKRRASFFDQVRSPFMRPSAGLHDILPADVASRLMALGKGGDTQPPAPRPVADVVIDAKPLEPVTGKVSIVWVWVKGAAVWNELAWSIKSVRKFYQGDCSLHVVGDNPEINGVEWIPADQVKGFAYCRSMDIAKKLRIIIARESISENFIFMYDDIMFLKPVTAETFSQTIAHDHVPDYTTYFRVGLPNLPSVKWRTLFTQTFFMLTKKGMPTYNYETHLPRMLNKSRLKEVMDRFYLDEQPYLFNSLYFNSYHKSPDIELRSNPRVKAGVYRPYDNPKSIAKELDGKTFLNFDDRGLNDLLKKEIQKRLSL